MATTQTTLTSKPKPVAVAAPATQSPKFEMPKFEIPKFEMPKMEMPAAFRELAEKGLAQAKTNYDKVKSAAEKATDSLEGAYTTASSGCSDYSLKLIETARTNSNAAFDLYGEFRSGREDHGLYALAVRHHDRAGQDAWRAGQEGGDRHRRADQGIDQLDEQSRLIVQRERGAAVGLTPQS